jgi:hypothetical protein
VESLPRYLSVELREDGPWVDGQRVSRVELARALRDAAGDPSIRGVAIVHQGGEISLQELLSEVAKAGLSHVVISGMIPEALGEGGGVAVAAVDESPKAQPPAPVETAPPVPATTAPVQPPAVPATAESAAAPASSAPSLLPDASEPPPDDVSVRHYGLHIGGIKDIEPIKDNYLKPIEKHFDEFRRCHALAKNRGLKASFGVDLLLSPSGGVPKVKDYRTLIKGKDFQLCALGVFAAVHWPLPEKPTVISYSVLFKPRGSE